MPKKIPANDMRQWLDEFDAGKSEVAIASDARKDIRTVKKYIARARRERELHAARVELFKNALKQHQDRLLGAVKEAEAGLVMPPHDLWRAWRQNAPASPLGLLGATATYEAGKGWVVTLAAEGKLEWGLLQQHLRGDPMWANLLRWRRAFVPYVAARVDLEGKCIELLTKKTGYKMVESSGEPPFLHSFYALSVAYQWVIDRAVGVDKGTSLEDMVTVDKKSGQVKYGINTVVAEAPGEEDRCKANIVAAINELLGTREAMRIRQTHKELEEATVNTRRSLEEILLFEVIPGECRVCRRFGT